MAGRPDGLDGERAGGRTPQGSGWAGSNRAGRVPLEARWKAPTGVDVASRQAPVGVGEARLPLTISGRTSAGVRGAGGQAPTGTGGWAPSGSGAIQDPRPRAQIL